MIDEMLIFIGLAVLAISSYTDIKTREVPDWVNYSLIFVGLGARLIYSIATNQWMFFLYGVAGFAIFLAIAYSMFYSAQWGGGDSKMLMGLGALIGFNFRIDSLFVSFLINMLIVGAVYGLLWSFVLAVLNWKKFFNEAKKLMRTKQFRTARNIFLIIALVILVFIFFNNEPSLRFILAAIAFILIFTLYVLIFVKAVERACMLKFVKPTELTIGEWIPKNIKYKGEIITGPKDLGIEKKQINKLIQLQKQGKIKKVLIKIGIPFVPSFFIAFIASLVFGNLFLMII